MLPNIAARSLIAILPLRLHLLHKTIIISMNQRYGHLLYTKALLHALACELLGIVNKRQPMQLLGMAMACLSLIAMHLCQTSIGIKTKDTLNRWGSKPGIIPRFALGKYRLPQLTGQLNGREVDDTAQTPTER